IGIFETVFHVTSLTMEVPTGMIADLYGRKFSRLLGILSYLVYIVIMVLSSNFILIVIAFIFCALGFTFESGSGDALVYDSLVLMKEEERFMKINGVKEVIYQVAAGFALFIGGYIAMTSFNISFWITAIFYVFAFIVILLMKETPLKNKSNHKTFKEMLVDHYVKSFKVVFHNKRLLYLIIIGAMVAAPITVVFLYFQNYLSIMGYSYFTIGIFLAIHSLFAAVGGFVAYKLEKKYKERKILIYLPLFMIITFWLILIDSIIFIPFIILGFFDSVFYVVLLDYMNKAIPSETRATALSFFGLTFSVVMVVIFPLMGLIGDSYGLKTSFFILAIIVTIFYIFLLRVLSKNHLKTT
ncbi:MAG: MFS transporter, partial [Candidatus Izimaplasma sp.]|nr:MFS transporter [Candidatus Izimaplasma bacterium]